MASEDVFVWRVGEGAWLVVIADTDRRNYDKAIVTFDGQNFSCSCGKCDDKKLCIHVLEVLRVTTETRGEYNFYKTVLETRQLSGSQQQQVASSHTQRASTSRRASTSGESSQRASTTRGSSRSRQRVRPEDAQTVDEFVDALKAELRDVAYVDLEGNELIITKKKNLDRDQWDLLWNWIQKLGARKVRGKNYAWHVSVSEARRAIQG